MSTLLSRDDCARIMAEAINMVFEKLHMQQTVEGIAVYPAGEDVWLVDVVIRNLSDDTTWTSLLIIPPVKEQTDKKD